MTPFIGPWISKQLYIAKISLRAFLKGYVDGKTDAESRDWAAIQQEILASTKSSENQTNTQQSNNQNNNVNSNNNAVDNTAQQTNTTRTTQTKQKLVEKLQYQPSNSKNQFEGITFVPKKPKKNK